MLRGQDPALCDCRNSYRPDELGDKRGLKHKDIAGVGGVAAECREDGIGARVLCRNRFFNRCDLGKNRDV